MGHITDSQYQKMIRARAWKRFIKERAVWDVSVALVISFLTGIAVAYLVEKPKSFSEIGWSEPIITAIVTVLFSFTIYTIIYIFGYLRSEPRIVHNEQADRLDKWDSKPFEANVKVFPFPESSKNDYVGLDIYNDEKFHLTDCIVKFERIMVSSKRNGKIVEIQSDNLNKLSGPFEVKSKDHIKLRIAAIYGNYIDFIYYGHPPVLIPPRDTGLEPGTYLIETKIFGNVNGIPIKPIDKTYKVVFRRASKSKHLQIMDFPKIS